MAALYIVSTPIGNLKDITIRALETLKAVDLILSEDTRTTKKILARYQIKKPLLSYHQHSPLKKFSDILEMLKKGKNLALVVEAGTPGISDPGEELIDFLISKMPRLPVVPLPGPSALLAAASISGIPMERFLFLGFPPKKKKRNKFFREIAESKYPVIFYESPYRILKSLQELAESERELNRKKGKIVVCREMTKKFETVYRGRVDKVIKEIRSDKGKGEFVVVYGEK